MQSESEKEFDDWNRLKKNIDSSLKHKNIFPKVGEVWVCILGKNLGSEQNGVGFKFLRPVLIIKKINNHIFWALPLSSKQKNLPFYYRFIDPMGRKGSVVFGQMRAVSIKRLRRILYVLDSKSFFKIKESLKAYF